LGLPEKIAHPVNEDPKAGYLLIYRSQLVRDAFGMDLLDDVGLETDGTQGILDFMGYRPCCGSEDDELLLVLYLPLVVQVLQKFLNLRPRGSKTVLRH